MLEADAVVALAQPLDRGRVCHVDRVEELAVIDGVEPGRGLLALTSVMPAGERPLGRDVPLGVQPRPPLGWFEAGKAEKSVLSK